MVKIKPKTISVNEEIYYCDYCGKELGDIDEHSYNSNNIRLCLSNKETTIFLKEKDMCIDCCNKNFNAIKQAIQNLGFELEIK